MKMVKYILLLAAACCAACSAQNEYEYDYSSRICYVNDSSHKVSVAWETSMSSSVNEKTGTLTLMPGESTEYVYLAFDRLGFPSFYLMEVCFDDSTIVRETKSDHMLHSSILRDNYELVRYSRYEGTFTYTFTDADYENAVLRSANTQ